jgi:hypothetical protein
MLMPAVLPHVELYTDDVYIPVVNGAVTGDVHACVIRNFGEDYTDVVLRQATAAGDGWDEVAFDKSAAIALRDWLIGVIPTLV